MLDDSLLVARNNRAMTYLKLGQWDGAVQDSQAVIDREPTNVKALLRLGNARCGDCPEMLPMELGCRYLQQVCVLNAQ